MTDEELKAIEARNERWGDVCQDNRRLLVELRRLAAESERHRAALCEIAAGRKAVDREHPLGDWCGMGGRFITIAQKALK